MTLPSRFRRLIPTAAVGAAFTLVTPTAPAFFPPLPTGSGPISVLPPAPAPVIPVSPTIPVIPVEVPVVPPPPFVPPPPGGVEEPQSPPPPPAQVVPEPGTLVSAALGLAAVGGVVWRRRRRS
jgi:hypothetical protein